MYSCIPWMSIMGLKDKKGLQLLFTNLFSRKKKKTERGFLLKTCGVMEALNKHERFRLESPIIPLNAYPFVY